MKPKSKKSRRAVETRQRKRVSVDFLEEERQAVRRRAFETETPFTEIVRAAVRQYLNLGPGPEIRRGPRKDS